MFDIGFTEMMIIAVVALVVIGPERLPKVARQAGEWMGKLRRYVDDVKSDINRQMQLDELRKIQSDVKDAAQNFKSSVDNIVSEAKSELSSLNSAFEGAASTTTEEPRTDWDRIYAVRRQRERIKDRRIERSKELGLKRPKRAYIRFTRPEPEIVPEPVVEPVQPKLFEAMAVEAGKYEPPASVESKPLASTPQ